MQRLRTAQQAPLSGLDQALWEDLIRRRCGLSFSAARLRLLKQALAERLQATGLASCNEYYHYVLFHPRGEEEWRKLLELLVNRETSFFRHLPSFAGLTDHVLPRLTEERAKYGGSFIHRWRARC